MSRPTRRGDSRQLILAQQRMGRPMPALVLSDEERRDLRGRIDSPATGPELALRIRIVLACAEGLSNLEVAARLGVHRATVGTWRRRFLASRLDGLQNQPKPGAPRSLTDAQVERVIVATLETVPDARPYWSARALAEQVGTSPSSVGRIWEAFGLQPRLVEAWKRANDPRSVLDGRSVVGLYLNPPEMVIALCGGDLKAVIRPIGHAGAAQMTPWRRVLEFQRFLQQVDTAVASALNIHLILGISATYTAPTVRRWLLGHPRVRLHFATDDSHPWSPAPA